MARGRRRRPPRHRAPPSSTWSTWATPGSRTSPARRDRARPLPPRRPVAPTLRCGRPASRPSVEADFSAAGGAAATRRLLDLAEPPTAIVYANDLMAIAGLASAQAAGLDRSRTTCRSPASTTPSSPRTSSPSLTTVAHRRRRLGRGRGTRLLELIDGAHRHRRRAAARAARRPRLDRPAPCTPDQPAAPQRTNGEHDETKVLTAALALLVLGATALRGRLGEPPATPSATRADHDLAAPTTPRKWPGASRWSTAWNADHADEKVTAQEIPAGKSSEEVIGAAITAGNAPCLIFNTSPAAVPQFQKQGGLVRARRLQRRRRRTSRTAPATSPSSTSRPTGSSTSCRGSRTR